jgi:hypothetical protein
MGKRASRIRNARDIRILKHIKTFITTQTIAKSLENDNDIIMALRFGERISEFIKRRSARRIYEEVLKYIWRPGGPLFLQTQEEVCHELFR